MERLSRFGALLIWMVAAATAENSNPNVITKTFRTNNGMVGVASVAGITSRNGRVSSVSGVKFYPAPGSQDMNFFFPSVKSGEKLPEPISFSKEENGRITSGSIKYGPGSVSVSSSARSAFPSGPSSTKFPKPLKDFNHDIDDMFFPFPMTPFTSRSFDPWFPSDISFRQPIQPRFDTMRPAWPYPSYGSFKYW